MKGKIDRIRRIIDGFVTAANLILIYLNKRWEKLL
jgi:hypothetical protein